MIKEQVIEIICRELLPVISAGCMSAKDRFWLRDENILWTAEEGLLLPDITADDITSVMLNTPDNLPDKLTRLAVSIMIENPRINILLLNRLDYSKTVSIAGENLKPYVDDIAQIIGIEIKSCNLSEHRKISRLLKRRSAVTIKGEGILCAASSPDEAAAVAIIADKAAFIHIQGSFIGKLTYIGKAESAFMRFVYRRKYSKQASSHSRGK